MSVLVDIQKSIIGFEKLWTLPNQQLLQYCFIVLWSLVHC